MWTWQFQLDDILTTLTIVGLIGGASYRLLILPILTRNEERMNRLNETLVELKEEIKLSREQRTREYAEHVKLVTRVDGIENRVDELRGDFHEHTAKAH
jgi:hypothetical protein